MVKLSGELRGELRVSKIRARRVFGEPEETHGHLLAAVRVEITPPFMINESDAKPSLSTQLKLGVLEEKLPRELARLFLGELMQSTAPDRTIVDRRVAPDHAVVCVQKHSVRCTMFLSLLNIFSMS